MASEKSNRYAAPKVLTGRNAWTIQLPSGNMVRFKARGTRESGIEYSAKVEGRDSVKVEKLQLASAGHSSAE